MGREKLQKQNIYRGTNIHTDVSYKPTDSKQYLMFNYCHPKHIKTSISYSLARRLRMIVSDEEVLTRTLSDIKDALLKQNYPQGVRIRNSKGYKSKSVGIEKGETKIGGQSC